MPALGGTSQSHEKCETADSEFGQRYCYSRWIHGLAERTIQYQFQFSIGLTRRVRYPATCVARTAQGILRVPFRTIPIFRLARRPRRHTKQAELVRQTRAPAVSRRPRSYRALRRAPVDPCGPT